MKEYFDTQIRPLNDLLGATLSSRRAVITAPDGKVTVVTFIDVKGTSKDQKIPVTFKYTSHSGNHVTRKAGTKSFYEAMGLKI